MIPAYQYVFLACGGAVIAASLGVLARLNLYYLMGLVPLFPTFALIWAWNAGWLPGRVV